MIMKVIADTIIESSGKNHKENVPVAVKIPVVETSVEGTKS